MKIDGRNIAVNVLKDLKKEVRQLKHKKIVPHLVVILVGNDPASLSYIRQKTLAAHRIGIQVTFHHLKKVPLYQKLAEFILGIVEDPNVHGIIIQRPLPPSLSADSLTRIISPRKDVDGFLPKSLYLPPLGIAVFKILATVYFKELRKTKIPSDDFSKSLLNWLKNREIVLIGRGETGGKPIAQTLQKYRVNFIMLHSAVENREDYLKNADIIISAVGKSDILKASDLKPGAILLSVGLHAEKKVLVGDYDEKTIHSVAGFYTPTPGGVGPVNVACLMQNVVLAAKQSKKR